MGRHFTVPGDMTVPHSNFEVGRRELLALIAQLIGWPAALTPFQKPMTQEGP